MSRYVREWKASAAWACFRPWVQEGPNTNMTQTPVNTSWPSNVAPAKLCGTNFADVGMDVALGADTLLSVFPGCSMTPWYKSMTLAPLVAGGTTEGLEPTAARLPVNLELNHPFFYTIRGNQTGALLFTGIAMNPNAG